jgi:hypothetical protein
MSLYFGGQVNDPEVIRENFYKAKKKFAEIDATIASLPTPGLSDVLAVGHDAGGYDIDNVGSLTASYLSGDGAAITNINAANIPALSALLGAKVSKTGDTMTGLLTLAGTPTNSMHAANKAYVDNLAAGMSFKKDCVVASTANVNISSAPASIDGVALSAGDRVLLKNQTAATENGPYVFNGTGAALTRSDDPLDDTGLKLVDAVFPIKSGTVNQDTWFRVITDSITLGVDPITLTQVAGSGTYTNGSYLKLTGNIFDIDFTTFTTANVVEGSNLYYTAARFNTDFGTKTTDNLTEGSTNKYWTNARTIASTLTGYSSGTGAISPSDSVLSAIQKLNGNIAAITGLPSQTGNSGKYLTTDGSSASWATVTATLSNALTVGTGLALNSGTTFDGSAARTISIDQGAALTWTALHTFNRAVSASGAIARGTYIQHTLTAAANNDVLVGLDIAPTYSNGSFTGVTNYDIRTTGTSIIPTILGGTTSGSFITLKGSTANLGSSSNTALQILGGNNGGSTLFKINNNGEATIGSSVNTGVSLTLANRLFFNVNGQSHLVFGSAGSNFGNIVNTTTGVWSFGFTSTITGAGTPVMSWNSGGSVTIGTTTDVTTSIFTMSSTTKGFLPPRMTSAQRTAISSPAVGLIVYQTDATEGLYVNKSGGWTFIA